MKKPKTWAKTNTGKSKKPISDFEKHQITADCQPLVKQFKIQYIRTTPDKRFNYLIDIYTRWRGNYLYFCEKYKSERENRIADEFEIKFARLEYLGPERFNVSYYRHTEQWFLMATGSTLQKCLEMMQDLPVFHPTG